MRIEELASEVAKLDRASKTAKAKLDQAKEKMMAQMDEHDITKYTLDSGRATITLVGPNSRTLLGEVTDGIDLGAKAFPFMTWRTGTVAGSPARIFRVSFTGDLSYEVNVPARYALAVWTALISAGAKYRITPFGTETMHVLRAEKGYFMNLIVG